MKNIFFLIIVAFIFNYNLKAQTGCNDPLASNYNNTATINDGSCLYPTASVTPLISNELNQLIHETSGLIEWNSYLYTHNDDTDTNIYQLDKTNGTITKTFALTGLNNIDWEEISQDESNLYIGDFGNNAEGNRTNLIIYKISKNSLSTTPQIETINFSYSNQTDFTPQPANKTDFDCEAMVVTSGGILLFTKQWLSNKTSIYKLSKTPGTQIANLLTTIDVSGLITGATIKADSNLIVLCGYSQTVDPFVFLIYDFNGTDFNISNKRKIDIPLPYHQIEGISTTDGLEYFLTNENFVIAPINNPQKLHKISLEPYLGNYLSNLSNIDYVKQSPKAILYPNPTNGEIRFESKNEIEQEFLLIDSTGKVIKKGILNHNPVNLDNISKGVYIFALPKTKETYKIIKQ